jgi:hypothetical protein
MRTFECDGCGKKSHRLIRTGPAVVLAQELVVGGLPRHRRIRAGTDERKREKRSCAPRIIVVPLRRPRRNQRDERRDDPFWEVVSFGCTKCHRANLMNPKRSHELDGAQFAFVQGGGRGFRLVHVTPPISPKIIGSTCEAKWSPPEMPMTYATAPVVVDGESRSDIRLLEIEAPDVSPISRFASAFRSRRRPLAGEVGAQSLPSTSDFEKSAKSRRVTNRRCLLRRR